MWENTGTNLRFDCGCEFVLTDDPYLENLQRPSVDIDLDKIPVSCWRTWQLIGTGRTKMLFQLESRLGQKWAKELKPENLEHLSALGTILRPGSLHALDEGGISVTQHYCNRKNGNESIVYDDPALEAILNKSYGLNIYQEDSMNIARFLASFTLQEADTLRKSIGKKSAELMAKVRKIFLDKAKETGILTEEKAIKIFNNIQESQRYSFNHCVSFDTKILRPSCNKVGMSPYTLDHMYKIKNDINYAKLHGQLSLYKKWKLIKSYGYGLSMCQDGRVRQNIIRNIQPSGIRDLYKITMENGSCIKNTNNHKFPTPNGEKRLDELNSGDLLYMCGEYEQSDFNKIGRFSNITRDELYRRKLENKSVNKAQGQMNWGYTNGSYTEFETNKLLLEDKCAKCEKTNCRLETHHINKDRTNSSLENLEKLCPSCHKKEDYKLGRVKKGQKGYPVYTCQIKSIEYVGKEMTYDVTMDGPNHNFVVDSKIITKNSHSYSYGINCYLSGYLKSHFPVETYNAWLLFAKDRKPKPKIEVNELVSEAKLNDIEVKTPDIRAMELNFYIESPTLIRFGLANVGGIGETTANKFVDFVHGKESEFGPFMDWSWYKILCLCGPEIGRTTILNWISVGAFNHLGMSRRLMTQEFTQFKDLFKTAKGELEWISNNWQNYSCFTDLLTAIAKPKKMGGGVSSKKRIPVIESVRDILLNPMSSMNDDPVEIAVTEENLLGVAISCSKSDGKPGERWNITCKDFMDGEVRPYMVFKVQVDEIHEHIMTRGREENIGRTMAFLKLSDSTCKLDNVTVWADQYEGNEEEGVPSLKSLLTVGRVLEIRAEPGKKGGLIVQDVWEI